MDYHEKKSIVSILSTVAVFGFYYWSVFQDYQTQVLTTEEELQFWSRAILMAIPVAIVSKIVFMILFTIFNKILANEDYPRIEDERDKLIDLKSTRNAFFIFGMGFVGAMAVLAFGFPLNYMFLTFILAGVASEIFEHLSRLYFLRKGV